jgi:hypothetical protein
MTIVKSQAGILSGLYLFFKNGLDICIFINQFRIKIMKSFVCFKCDRRQSATLGDKLANKFGWRKMENGKWMCPFCCGNTDMLLGFFDEKGL